MKAIKELSFLLILLLLSLPLSFGAWPELTDYYDKTPPADLPAKPATIPAGIEAFAKKLHFEPNDGQTDASVHFLSRGNGYTLFLTTSEAILAVKNADAGEQSQGSYSMIRMQLEGANPAPHIAGHDILPGITNYFIGNRPEAWHTHIANFASVEYQDMYPGIDLVYYGNEGRLEFDFIVSPDGNPNDILLNFISGANIRIDEDGNLVIPGQGNPLILKQPVAYQDKKEGREMIDAKFSLAGDNQVMFNVGDYDPQYPLIIDPVLVYFSYLGGSKSDNGSAIAVDAAGCAYVTGSTSSVDFPMRNGFQNNIFPDGYSDIFVTKFNAGGTDIIYSTYIGGNCYDTPDAIAVDANGQVYITGRTCSWDNEGTPGYDGFPLMNAYQTEYGTQYDAFVTVLSSSGGLAYSTYLGGDGDDYATDIAVDSYGNAYVTGTEFSFDFPVKNAFMAKKPSYYYDTFVTKIDPTKSGDGSLVYSTHLGGYYDDYSSGIAVDRYGCAYVTGKGTKDFPTTANAIQPEWQGKKDAYVTKLSADGLSLVYSTYLGDTLDNWGNDIKVDDSCCAYVSGYAPIPITPGAFTAPGSSFICKLNPSGDGFVYSARLNINNLALDKNGNVFGSCSYGLGKGGGLMGLNADGTDTLFNRRISVIPTDLVVDADSNMYITGGTDSTGLATENAYQTSFAGSYDAFIAKFKIEPEEMLIVKVLSDPLYADPLPVTAVLCDIYSIDLSNRANPLTFLERRNTDEKGLLHLPESRYQPDMPIFIRVMPEMKRSVKNNRTEKTAHMCKIYVDNLIIDKNGNVSAQFLESEPEDTTLTYLGHTAVGFSLIVSIEWLASQAYISNLVNAFIQLSNRLYDVTNGQAFIDTVAVFDNGSRMNDADIKIFASNLQWPCALANGATKNHKEASVFLPPVWDGDDVPSIEMIYNADQIDPATSTNVMTMVHELGHYILGFRDEYEDIMQSQIFPPPVNLDLNFGFMDDQYNLQDPRSTEMSDYEAGDPLFNYYKVTEHFDVYGQNCWQLFQNTFGDEYPDVIAMIHRPKDLGISSDNVMKGPNSDIAKPDFSVGDMMGFEHFATMTTNPRLDILITASPAGGLPVPFAQTTLHKKGMTTTIDHGVANHEGRIKLFNAEEGDTIIATHKDHNNWRYKKIIVAPAKKSTGGPDQIVELSTVNGPFTLLSGLAFDATGAPEYRCLADPEFESAPSIRVFDDVSASEKQLLSASEGTYSAVLNTIDFTEGSVFFSAPDNNGEEFFIFQDASIREVSEEGIIADRGLQLEYRIDTLHTGAEKLAFLASAFPAPLKGLPDSVRRVSDVVSVNVWPDNTELKMQMQVQYFADSLEAVVSEAMTMYRWEDGWVPLETGVNLERRTVTAAIDGPGYFAAYLDLTQSRLISHIEKDVKIETLSGFQLLPNYPNPFEHQTTIRYRLAEYGQVVIKVYNPVGQEVSTLLNAFQGEGEHEVVWQPIGLPAGLYFCRLIVMDGTSKPDQGFTAVGKMMLKK